MTDAPQLMSLLAAPLEAAAGLDLSDPEAARSSLEAAYPSNGDTARKLRQALLEAAQDGLICDRGDDNLRYSRLAKAEPASRDFSIDLVWMMGPGPRHRHPKGEVNLCFATEGEPEFDGQPEGWVVFPPGSTHVPTVSSGRMLIAYFLPGGEMEWVKD